VPNGLAMPGAAAPEGIPVNVRVSWSMGAPAAKDCFCGPKAELAAALEADCDSAPLLSFKCMVFNQPSPLEQPTLAQTSSGPPTGLGLCSVRSKNTSSRGSARTAFSGNTF